MGADSLIDPEYLADTAANYTFAIEVLRQRLLKQRRMETTMNDTLAAGQPPLAVAQFDPATVDFPADISNSGGSAASGREAFVACPTKWVNHHLRKLERTVNIHLHAGGSFAKGMEVARRVFFKDGGTEEDARQAGMQALWDFYGDEYAEVWQGEAKSRDGMRGALSSYLTTGWPLASDYLEPFESEGKGVEFDFAIPLPINHPQTGEPILYKGRIDWLARNKQDGSVWVVDDKTTGSLGKQWHKQWDLDSQPTGYVWAARQFGFPVAGVILRGTSILKRGYGHEECLQPRTKYQIDDWHEQLVQDLHGMITTWTAFQEGRRVTKRLDKSACNAYGGCPYVQSCSSPNPEAWFTPPRDPLAKPLPVDMGGLLDDL